MKKIKLSLLSMALVAIIIYLLTVFVRWNFDLSTMDTGNRFMLVWIYISVVWIPIIAICENDRLKDN